jgi:tetratricopeptide (TPR) repeat protein
VKAGYPLLILATTLLVYSNSFKGNFHYDDLPSIVENPSIRSPRTAWRAAFLRGQGDITIAGRPLAAITFALNYQISGMHIWSYRLVNQLIHCGSALLLYGIARRTLRMPRVPVRLSQHADGIACAIALIWAVHPLHVVSVTYVVQRVESLAGLLMLLSLWCVICGSASATAGWWYAGAVAACAAGMGVKETVAVTPVLVLLYDRAFLVRSVGEALRQRRALYLGLFACWVIAALLFLSGPRKGLMIEYGPYAWLEYLRIQCYAIPRYLRVAFFPIGLVVDYGGPLVSLPIAASAAGWVPGAIIVGILIVVTIVLLIRRPMLGFLGVWFLLILAPSSSVVPIFAEAIAEQRTYLPLAAVVTSGVLIVASITALPRLALSSLSAAVVIAMGSATLWRNWLFRDDVRLWSHDVAVWPDNSRSRTALGLALVQQENFVAATEQFEQAIRIKPQSAEAHHNLGDLLLRQRRYAEAEREYLRAIELPPPSFRSHYNLGQLLLLQRRMPQAAERLRRAAELAPPDAQVLNAVGIALARSGRVDWALECFRAALRVQPDNAEAQANLRGAEQFLSGQK